MKHELRKPLLLSIDAQFSETTDHHWTHLIKKLLDSASFGF